MSPPRTALAARAVVLVIQGIALGTVASGLAGAWGFPLDDAWIHQVVARNVALHGSLRLDLELPSCGTSSLVWTALLAAGQLLRADPVAWALGLGAVGYLAFGQLLLGVLLQAGVPVAEAALFAAASALSGNFAWFAASGMETTLFCAAGMAALHLWTAPPTARRRASAARVGAALAVLTLVRPEGALVGVVLAFTRDRARRTTRELAVALGVGAASGLPLLALALAGAWPTTLAARAWLYGVGGLPVDGAVDLIAQLLRRLQAYALPSDAGWAVGLYAVVTVAGVVRLWRAGGSAAVAPLVWAALNVAFYAVVLPNVGHAGRYQPLAVALALAPASVGIVQIFTALGARSGASSRASTWARAGLLAAAAALASRAASLREWRGILHENVALVRDTHVAMAGFVRDDLPAGERVASFDVGAIAYGSGRPVLDLGGLADPALLPRLRDGEVDRYLLERGVRWVILPRGKPWFADDFFLRRLGLAASERIALDLRHETAASPSPSAFRANVATDNAFPRQALFAVLPRSTPGR